MHTNLAPPTLFAQLDTLVCTHGWRLVLFALIDISYCHIRAGDATGGVGPQHLPHLAQLLTKAETHAQREGHR